MTVAPPEPAALTPAHLACPHETDAWLRTHEPVHHATAEDCWVVSRFEDVQEALRRPDVFSNRFGRVIRGRDRLTPAARAVLDEGWAPVDTLFTTDPPEHRRFRSLVNRAFTARRVAGMEGYIRRVAADLLDSVMGEAPTIVDVVDVLAVPLPLTVIADQLGVPREDLHLFKRWSQAVVSELGRLSDADTQLASARAVVEFQHYFKERVDERRAVPHDDILGDLVRAGHEDGEEPLDDQELLITVQQLLVAGNETTTNGITAAVWLLARDPRLQAELRRSPARVPVLVEEALRLEAPIQGMWRVTTRDVELGGTTIPAGALVMLRYGSANRDEAHYAAPAHVDLDRDQPRDHLAFGGGIHFCVGAALARSEIAVALELLLDRTSDLRLAPGATVDHPPHLLIRAVPSLPVHVVPSRGA